MSSKIADEIVSEFVQDIHNSDYEFNRFDNAALTSDVSALKLSINTISYAGWEQTGTHLFKIADERLSSQELDAYCFITNPTWRKNTPVVSIMG